MRTSFRRSVFRRTLWPVILGIGSVAPVPAQISDATKHWAFRPVQKHAPPAVANPEWLRNPIDAFILRALEKAGLQPSPRADRWTLHRRLSLNLTGLPPRENAIEAFVGDDSPQAFASIVDRLLADRGYGERWGRHWLDVARYADAKGYVDAGEARYPFAYTYRDYVIRAFNKDLPFNRFVLEQVAADRLENGAGKGSLAALGFLTVGSRFNFFPHEIIDDRIDVVTRGFLGLSVSCARCHDHKYDPVSSRDYYALYAVFANSREPTPDEAPGLTDPGAGEDEAFRRKLKEVSDKYAKLRAELHDRIMREMRGWAGDYLRYIVQTTPRHRTRPQAALRTERGLVRVVSAYSSGGVTRWKRFLETREVDDPVFGLWARLWPHGRTEIADRFGAALREWQADGAANALFVEAFEGEPIASMADVADIYSELLEGIDRRWMEEKKDDPSALALADATSEEVRLALYGPGTPGTMTLDESEDLYLLNESTEVRQHFANIERVFLEAEGRVAPRPMLLVDRDRPVEQRVFQRGDPQQPGDRVDPGVPALFRDLRAEHIDTGSGRLELARMIAHPDNPLTARVVVNRVWAWHFGRGLVDTPSDFGVRSATPTHPLLLDYLAAWFVENGWSLKKLHRLILTSNTWQQASVDRPAARAVDPENRLLWRMNRRRLDFEAMRDAMLFLAGHLEPCSGGPPLRKRPDDVANRNRTVYTYIDREKLPEICRVFDLPSPDITAPARSQTTVPQQSLFLLNSPFVIAQAESLAQRCGVTGDNTAVDAGLDRLYGRVYARLPDTEERAAATRFLATGDLRNRWVDLAQALLLSNEFLFVD